MPSTVLVSIIIVMAVAEALETLNLAAAKEAWGTLVAVSDPEVMSQ